MVGVFGIICVVVLVIKVGGYGNGEISLDGLVWLKCKVFKFGDVEKFDLEGIKLDCWIIFLVGLVIFEVIFDVLELE